MVDAVRTSNPNLQALKPQEPAAKPATAPAAAPAAAAATTDQFVANDPAAVNPLAAASPVDAPAATEPVTAPEDPKPSEATEENREVTADMTTTQEEAYNNLTDPEREQYNDLYSAAEELNPPQKAEDAQEQLLKLLDERKVGEYVAVAKEVDVQAQEELQNRLFDGTLLEGAEGEALLDVLEPFASGTTDLTTEVNRGELVSQILHDISNPEAAAEQQADQRDCGLLSMLATAASVDPAGYAAMMINLAEGGTLTLNDGKGNPVELRYEGTPNPDDPEERTVTQQMWVGTLENFANGVNGDGGALERIIGEFDKRAGITAREMADFEQGVLEQLDSDGNYEPMTVPDEGEAGAQAREQLEAEARARGETEPIISDEDVQKRADEIRAQSQSDAMTVIDEQIAGDEEVQVQINGPPSHWETVVDKMEIPLPFGGSIERYLVRDGKGGETWMTPDQLEGQLGAVVYNAETSRPPEGSYRPQDDDPGIGFRNDSGTGEGDGI